VQLCAKKIIEQAKDRKMPLVIDGDGISSVVCVWPSLVEGYKVAPFAFWALPRRTLWCSPQPLTQPLSGVQRRQEVVLTPNFPEYQRLCKAAGCEEDTPVMDLARKYVNDGRHIIHWLSSCKLTDGGLPYRSTGWAT
jgi:hypothetical protein